ncbi:MAG: sucrose-6-phosphate hydrolase [Bacillota bacterium]
MGKPYKVELLNLIQTYQWSLEIPIEKICSFVNESYNKPLLSVGSGGSLTAAYMAALLHQRIGMISKAVTPLELFSSGKTLRNCSVFILTAGGSNADILSAFTFAAISEPRHLIALCMKKDSPLAILAREYRYTNCIDYDLPSGKDGFLATNSLLATLTILIRSYQKFIPDSLTLPQSISSYLDNYEEISVLAGGILDKDTLVVLYGSWGLPIAIDAESKFTEAALAHIQIADYRNFAHGRHHWLAKRGEEVGVVALITPEEKKIAEKTLDLLPKKIPTIKLITDKTGPVGSLDLFVKMLHLVYLVGKDRSIDPGKPGVPSFGRRIYNLRFSRNNKNISLPRGIDKRGAIAIARKCGYNPLSEMKAEELEFWKNAYLKFIQKFEGVTFGTVVFDYDGTLCDPSERYSGPPEEIGWELVRLLNGGIIIGIATGRGKSVRTDLQNLIPKKHWGQVVIGYYNGSDIALLNEEECPDKVSPLDPSLRIIKNFIDNHPIFGRIAKYECRPKQITVEPQHGTYLEMIKSVLIDIIAKNKVSSVQVLESSHSIDVIAPGVSKLHLVSACEKAAKKVGKSGIALCIGDKGKWPGNDYELLSTPYSISVDTVSPDPESCWNLSQSGHRGVQATIHYLKSLVIFGSSGLVFSLKRE